MRVALSSDIHGGTEEAHQVPRCFLRELGLEKEVSTALTVAGEGLLALHVGL